MAIRYYFVPRIGDGLSPQTAFRPKYTDPGSLGAGWNPGPYSAMDYGLEDVFLVALNLDATQHATLSAESDVLAVPAPENTVSAGAVATVKAKLEAGNVPADWVVAGMTYRQVLSRVMRCIQFMQRFRGIFGRLFNGGATLDTRINQLPANARQALNQAAQSMGANTDAIAGATLIRQALVIVADQLAPAGIRFGGEVF